MWAFTLEVTAAIWEPIEVEAMSVWALTADVMPLVWLLVLALMLEARDVEAAKIVALVLLLMAV